MCSADKIAKENAESDEQELEHQGTTPAPSSPARRHILSSCCQISFWGVGVWGLFHIRKIFSKWLEIYSLGLWT